MPRWPRSEADGAIWLSGMSYGLLAFWGIVLVLTFTIGLR
jgi:hypothetical protein